ncbi:MAG: tetratricopeptide repeat protein [Myxococcales bacterium]|nr:tetratricopeptide repeat protein [Myxococcales bacterium]
MTLATRPAAAVALAASLVACGGGQKESKEPKEKPAKADPARALAEARAAAKAGELSIADEKYTEAAKGKADVAIIEEHVGFLLASALPDRAVEVARRYYDINPAEPRAGLLYVHALIGAGDFATAIEVATGVVDLDGKSAAGYEARGRALVMAGKLEEGIEDLRKAVELEPRNAGHLTSLGSALEQAKKPDEAALQLRAAIEADPQNARALRLLGVVRRAQFETQESVSWLMKATKADPTDAEAWFQLAVSQNDMSDNLEAEDSAQKATALAPTVSRYWYVYGEMLRINKKVDESIAAYRRAIDARPPHPKAAGKLAKVLYENDRPAEAEVFLTDLLQTDRNNPDLWFNLGFAYAAQKKTKLAIEALEKFLELASKDDGLRKAAEAELKILKRRR